MPVEKISLRIKELDSLKICQYYLSKTLDIDPLSGPIKRPRPTTAQFVAYHQYMGSILRWLAYMFFCGACLLLGLSFWYELAINTELLPKVAKLQKLQTQIVPDFLEDQKWLTDTPLFAPGTKQANFQDHLAQVQILHGESTMAGHPKLHPLFITSDIQAKMMSFGSKWIEKSHHLRHVEIDLSLFDDAMSYDYWSHDSPEIKWPEEINPFSLVIASKVFILKSIRDKRSPIEVLERIRKVSRLMASVDKMNFKLSALSLLEIEAQAFRIYSKRTPSSLANWKPYNKNEVLRTRRILLATSGFLEPWTASSTLERIFLTKNLPVGFCAAYKAKHIRLQELRPFFLKQFPFEVSFEKNLQTLKKVEKKYNQICKTGLSDPSQESIEATTQHIPFYRRVKGIRLSVNDVHLFQDYIY